MKRIYQGPDSKKATTRIYGMSPLTQTHRRCDMKAKLKPLPHLGISGRCSGVVFVFGNQLFKLFLGNRLVGNLGEFKHEVDDFFLVDRST